MVRSCTICQHPERRAIDRAIVERVSYRTIAKRFACSPTAALRHAGEHLLPEIAEGWQAERERNNADLVDRLRSWMAVTTKLLAACDEWLLDPDDPERYTLEPRSSEIVIHMEEHMGPRQRPIRRKMKLSEAIARVEGKPGMGDLVMAEHRTADPRKLVVSITKTLESNLRLMGELQGKLQTVGTNNFLQSEDWAALRTRMLAALSSYPEARLALAAVVYGEDTATDGP